MEERRKFVRLDTRLDVNYVVLPSGTAQRTVTKDIGGGGICMIVERQLPLGSRLQVALKLPDREQPINFIGEVMWSEPYEVIGKSEHRKAVECGLRFVEIAPADQEAVMRHVILTLQSGAPAR